MMSIPLLAIAFLALAFIGVIAYVVYDLPSGHNKKA